MGKSQKQDLYDIMHPYTKANMLSLHVSLSAHHRLMEHEAFSTRLFPDWYVGTAAPELLGYVFGAAVYQDFELADGLAEIHADDVVHTFRMPD